MNPFAKLPLLLPVLAGGFLSLVLAGCGGGTDPAEEAMAEGVFLINNGAEPRSLDPHVVTGMPEHRVIKSLLEGLVADHPTDSDKVAPGMAHSWEANGDASEWTFYLREATWSNGDPVTAAQFLYAFRRILNPDFGAPYVSMLFRVENARAYNEGRLEDFAEVGVKAPEPDTLVVTLDGPTPYFPLMLTHYTWFPVHPDTLETFDAFTRRDTGWTLPENHVGNGPFLLKEWKPNQRIIVEKNPRYWDAGNVGLNAIHFFPVQDRQTENRMFRSGQLHKTDGIPYNLRQRYREDNHPAFRQDPMFATGYLGLNTRHEGLGDRRVRKALSLALDRALIVREVTKNGKPAGGFVPPGISDYPNADRLPFDPGKARELLAEAGYPDGEGFPVLEFILANSDTSRTLAEVLQEMWRRELGIEIRILNKEWQVLISDMDNGHFDVFLLSWIGDYLDPATFLKIMRTGDGNNRTGFGNASYDDLLAKADRQDELAERYRLLREAEDLLLDELPILPLSWSEYLYLLHPEINGWASKSLMDQPYKAVRFGKP